MVNITHGPKGEKERKEREGGAGESGFEIDPTTLLPPFSEERLLITGLHTVQAAVCCQCAAVRKERRRERERKEIDASSRPPSNLLSSLLQILGWTYITAFEESQRYKEGKTILEKAMISVEDGGGGALSS